MIKKLLLTFIFSILSIGCSESKRDIPKELFDIKLGEVYDFGDGTKKDFGDLPIKSMGGTEQSMTIGIHYYFQPLKENKTFPYKELKKNSTDEYFSTSHHLYLLPVIPNSIKTVDELNNFKIRKFEIAEIDWSDKKEDAKSAYLWTSDICKTFSADLKVKAEISSDYKTDYYKCAFIQSDRRIEIYNLDNFIVFRLSNGKEELQKKIDAIDERIRKMEAKEILK